MKTYTKKTLLLFIVIFTLIISACGKNNSQEDKNEKGLELKSADVVSSTSPYTEGMNKMSEDIAEATDGRITINHFPDGQLGDEGEILEGLKIGTIDMAITGYSGSDALDQLFYLPYLFENNEHLKNVINGEIGQEITEIYEQEIPDLKLLGFVYFAPRILTTKGAEVSTPEDLKGLKIRVPEDEMLIKTWKALGATPTPIAFPELFTSLQSGVVNGQENPYEIVVNNSFYEVQDTVIETNHSLPVRFFIMSKKTYDSLSDEDKETIEEVWKETAEYIEELYLEQEDEYISTLKENGMKFITPDVNAFKEATKDIWKDYLPASYGEDFYEKIQNAK